MTTTTTVRLDGIYDAMRLAFRNAITTGRNWHGVTVQPDGEVTVREEVSRCFSAEEYYRRGRPHPVTVWSMNGDASLDADQIENEIEAFDPAEVIDPHMRQILEEAGYAVED